MTLETISLDSEWEWNESDHYQVYPVACVSWAKLDDSAGLWHWTEAKRHVARALESQLIIGHSIHTDLAAWWRTWPEFVSLIWEALADGRVIDIRLAQKLADISDGQHESPRFMVAGRPYTLKAICHRHDVGELDKDTWRKEYGVLRDLPLHAWPEGAKKYPIDDARGALRAFVKIRDKFGVAAMGDVVRQTRHNFACHLLQVVGIGTDPELVEVIRDKTWREVYEEIAPRLTKNNLLRFENKGSKRTPDWGHVKNEEVVRELMRVTCPPELKRMTKTGLKKRKEGLDVSVDDYISTDAEACEDSCNDLLGLYSEYKHLNTFLNVHVQHLATGQIHAHFESLRETGRVACGEPYNLTNLPQGENPYDLIKQGLEPRLGVRECFVPRSTIHERGWMGIRSRSTPRVYIDVDYPGLELHTISQMCLDMYGRSEMAKALTAKPTKNLHSMFAAYLIQIPYEEGVKRKKAQEGKFVRMYEVAKRCNFGLGGGMGAARFRAQCKTVAKLLISLDEAKAFIQAWRKFWPEMEIHFARCKSLTGSFKNPRKARMKMLRVDRWRGGLIYTEACNTLFQALGSDCAKDSLFDVSRACYDPAKHSVLLGSIPVNFVHDDILTETDEDGAHECAVEQARIMNETANTFLVDVPIAAEPGLSRRFSKFASTIYDAHGRLVPWEHPAIEGRAA